MPLIAPLGIILGGVLPWVFIPVRPFIPWIFGIVTLSGALKIRVQELGKAASSPLPILFFFFTAHVFMPLVVFLLSSLIFRNDPDTVSGYVLLYSVPTAVVGLIWVSIFRGDPALALTLILLDSILAPVVVPGTARLLLRTSISLDMTGMAVSLIFMVVIPTIIGVSMNELSRGKIPSLISPWLNPFSKLCLVLIMSANAAAVVPQIRLDNPKLLIVLAVCLGLSVLGFMCGKFAGLFGKLNREKQITFFFASGLRNISAALVLAIEFFPASAALPALLGIMFQQTNAAIMGRVFWGKINENGQQDAK